MGCVAARHDSESHPVKPNSRRTATDSDTVPDAVAHVVAVAVVCVVVCVVAVAVTVTSGHTVAVDSRERDGGACVVGDNVFVPLIRTILNDTRNVTQRASQCDALRHLAAQRQITRTCYIKDL